MINYQYNLIYYQYLILAEEEYSVTTKKEEVNEFVAKIYCDLGKNVVTIGVASYFFKDMPLPFRIGLSILGIGFMIYSVQLFKQGGK